MQRKNQRGHNCGCLKREFLMFERVFRTPALGWERGETRIFCEGFTVEIKFIKRRFPGRCAAQPRSCAISLSPQGYPEFPHSKICFLPSALSLGTVGTDEKVLEHSGPSRTGVLLPGPATGRAVPPVLSIPILSSACWAGDKAPGDSDTCPGQCPDAGTASPLGPG